MISSVTVAAFCDEMEKIAFVLPSTIVGAGGGAIMGSAAGAASAKPGKRGKGALRGALAGGAVGGGVGAIRGAKWVKILRKHGLPTNSADLAKIVRGSASSGNVKRQLAISRAANEIKGSSSTATIPLTTAGAGGLAGMTTRSKPRRDEG